MNLFEYQLAALKPDLVVLDLGGNDFYGYGLNEDEFRARVEEVIGYIRMGAPNTAILLSCAQDMYRGRVNITAAREAAQLAKQIAYSNGCGFYNYFGAAGGPLSMQYWRRFQLAQSDRVHLTPAGYNYKAQLFYNALLTSYALALKDSLRSPEYFDSLPTPTFMNPEKTMPPATAVRNNNNTTTEYYIVRSGDNLGKIARQFGVSVAQLQAWNHLNTHILKIGRRLIVSPPGIDTATAQKTTHHPVNIDTKPPVIIKKNENNTKVIKYTIQKGDNFYNIAKKYSLTVNDIIQANPEANPNRLQIGDVILIPIR
jgi:LysM repeat protein